MSTLTNSGSQAYTEEEAVDWYNNKLNKFQRQMVDHAYRKGRLKAMHKAPEDEWNRLTAGQQEDLIGKAFCTELESLCDTRPRPKEFTYGTADRFAMLDLREASNIRSTWITNRDVNYPIAVTPTSDGKHTWVQAGEWDRRYVACQRYGEVCATEQEQKEKELLGRSYNRTKTEIEFASDLSLEEAKEFERWEGCPAWLKGQGGVSACRQFLDQVPLYGYPSSLPSASRTLSGVRVDGTGQKTKFDVFRKSAMHAPQTFRNLPTMGSSPAAASGSQGPSWPGWSAGPSGSYSSPPPAQNSSPPAPTTSAMSSANGNFSPWAAPTWPSATSQHVPPMAAVQYGFGQPPSAGFMTANRPTQARSQTLGVPHDPWVLSEGGGPYRGNYQPPTSESVPDGQDYDSETVPSSVSTRASTPPAPLRSILKRPTGTYSTSSSSSGGKRVDFSLPGSSSMVSVNA